ncbi:lamin tail domain-containing protein [Streptosporangium sandarakinum]|uniref:lamin tail domain-containing protein n=1 Tax=Streptosporangium sandarakinum TaxID=1260955 RepID=UPI0037A5F691
MRRPLVPFAVAGVAACATALLPHTASAAALPAVQIVKVYYDSPGADLRSNASLNGEYVTIRNTTRQTIALAGWSIRDRTGYRYTLGEGIALGPGRTLTLRTGQGRDGTSTLYWGRRAYVWNNDRDAAYLRRADGRLVDSCSYNSTRADYVNCA